MTEEEKWFNKCEKLYPKLREGRCCAVCLSRWKVTPATEIHHIIPRITRITRFDLMNLIPLCHYHHQMITDKKLDEPISTQHREYLQKRSLQTVKGYCIAHGITTDEFYKEQYYKMKDQLL